MNLIQRATNIILKPKSEWQVIAEEPAATAELYRGYVMPLAAIGPIAQFIGVSLIGVSLPFMGSSTSPWSGACRKRWCNMSWHWSAFTSSA